MVLKCADYAIDAAVFEEFTETADTARQAAALALQTVFDQRKSYEADQERVAAQAAELEKLKAEAVERERLAQIEREAKYHGRPKPTALSASVFLMRKLRPKRYAMPRPSGYVWSVSKTIA